MKNNSDASEEPSGTAVGKLIQGSCERPNNAAAQRLLGGILAKENVTASRRKLKGRSLRKQSWLKALRKLAMRCRDVVFPQRTCQCFRAGFWELGGQRLPTA